MIFILFCIMFKLKKNCINEAFLFILLEYEQIYSLFIFNKMNKIIS